MSRRSGRNRTILPNPNREKPAAVCQSCRFKANSERALHARRAVDPSLGSPYSGQMTGVYEGNVLVASFDNDVQVGFIAIPAVHVFGLTAQMNDAAGKAMQELANKAAAAIEAQVSTDDAVEVEEEDEAVEETDE